MPRQPREYCESGYYHVILRGVNKTTIFCDDVDCQRFLDTLNRYMKQLDTLVIAYCLMGNHVHMLLKATDDGLGQFMKCVEVSYVSYFNRKYDRSGHLFEARYKCKPIENDEYFLTVLRYILMNPEVAGIGSHDTYRWSNYGEFVQDGGWTDAKSIYEIVLKDRDEFLSLLSSKEEDDICDAELSPITDDMTTNIVKRVVGGDAISVFRTADAEFRTDIIDRLRKSGLAVRQISEALGINRGSVNYYLSKTLCK